MNPDTGSIVANGRVACDGAQDDFDSSSGMNATAMSENAT
jgi:hypothetical protein